MRTWKDIPELAEKELFLRILEEEIGEEYAVPYLDVVRTHDRFEVVQK